jgi:RNA recognition motif-containing protein
MKLFVANIDKQVSEVDLKNLFHGCGEVESVKIITDRATGIQKSFGFIEMPNENEAQFAIDHIPNQKIAGRQLTVVQAKPKSSFH